ncbi:hypothetical protein ACWFRB_05825 [Rhodococcus sp. NPDC055112]
MTVERIDQLCTSPGGGVLLGRLADGVHTLAELADPVRGPDALSESVDELRPWWDGHRALIRDALRRAGELRELAAQVVQVAESAGWWASLDRDSQVWLKPYDGLEFPVESSFRTPREVGGFDRYAQRPLHRIATSTLTTRSTPVGGWSAHHACASARNADWVDGYEAHTRTVRISPDARVAEIGSAQDWHDLVSRFGVADPMSGSHDPVSDGEPWGANDGLVPNWQAIASEYDGVHVTAWAFLTATQVRVASAAGWTEAWAFAGEETTWLRWAFDEVGAPRPFEAG